MRSITISEPNPMIRMRLASDNIDADEYWICEMFGYCSCCDVIVPFNMEADILVHNTVYMFDSCDEKGNVQKSKIYKLPKIFYIPRPEVDTKFSDVCPRWHVIPIDNHIGEEIFNELNSRFRLSDLNDISSWIGRR